MLVCDECGVKLEGNFIPNEFATLPPEDLHFLRVFVQSEGRVRDMEAALGLSYPTIRTRLAALKARLSPERLARADAREEQIRAILQELSKGKLRFEEALARIQEVKGEAP